MKRRYSLLILVLMLLIPMITLNSTVSYAHSGDVIYSNFKKTSPFIDGNFNSLNEWNDGTMLHLTNPFEVFVYIKHDNSFLYFCFDTVGDISNDLNYDQCNIFFDTDHNGVPTVGADDVFAIMAGFGGIHGVDDSSAGYTPTVHCYFNSPDPDHIGLEGACNFGISPNSMINHQIYEFKIPLALLDTSMGQTLGFCIDIIDNLTPLLWPNGLDISDLTTFGDLVLSYPSTGNITVFNLSQSPDKPTPIDSVVISANVSCSLDISNVTLWYSVNKGGWNQQSMSLIKGTVQNGIWEGTIPAFPWNYNISYYITIYNNISNSVKLGPFNYTVLGYEYPHIINVTQYIYITQLITQISIK
ncbi:MAG: hypothetical protein ACTSPQ_16435 [Candidatus Helarchaeota archaeon]